MNCAQEKSKHAALRAAKDFFRLIPFLFILVISCVFFPNKSYVQNIEPKINMDQARINALDLMKRTCPDSAYLKDSVYVRELRDDLQNWHVLIKHSREQAPPYFVILVDKITGTAINVSNELE